MLWVKQVGKQARGLATVDGKRKQLLLPSKQESAENANPRPDKTNTTAVSHQFVLFCFFLFKAAPYPADFIKNMSGLHLSREGGKGGNNALSHCLKHTQKPKTVQNTENGRGQTLPPAKSSRWNHHRPAFLSWG